MINNNHGFTLLEVLIALVIFAVISMICYLRLDASIRASTRIEQRYMALWIADNQLDEIYSERDSLSPGGKKSEIKVGSQKWQVKAEITETEVVGLNKIEVTAYSDEKSNSPVLTLTRFIGKK
jgi:general secretion pathway protein I